VRTRKKGDGEDTTTNGTGQDPASAKKDKLKIKGCGSGSRGRNDGSPANERDNAGGSRAHKEYGQRGGPPCKACSRWDKKGGRTRGSLGQEGGAVVQASEPGLVT
jgi:hypothetical protein